MAFPKFLRSYGGIGQGWWLVERLQLRAAMSSCELNRDHVDAGELS